MVKERRLDVAQGNITTQVIDTDDDDTIGKGCSTRTATLVIVQYSSGCVTIHGDTEVRRSKKSNVKRKAKRAGAPSKSGRQFFGSALPA